MAQPIPVPWQLGRAGCGAAIQSGAGGSFRDCLGGGAYAGVKLHRSPIRRQLECWLVFACAKHVDQIDAARPLLDRDRAVQREWGRQRELALAGRRHEPPKPLATGPDAKALHERALGWAAAHPASG